MLDDIVKKQLTISSLERLNLETYISPNFMGFFLNDDCAQILKSIAELYVKELLTMSKSTMS